jgi:hypothetical protein
MNETEDAITRGTDNLFADLGLVPVANDPYRRFAMKFGAVQEMRV